MDRLADLNTQSSDVQQDKAGERITAESFAVVKNASITAASGLRSGRCGCTPENARAKLCEDPVLNEALFELVMAL